MMSERHERWMDRLSEYLDGDLSETDRVALDEHLAECAACRGVLADLRAVVAEARRLDGVAPERDLWPDIAAAIRSPAASAGARADVIQLPTAHRVAKASGIFLTVPQLAAASIVLAMVSAAATLWAGPGLGSAPVREAQRPATEQVAFPVAAEAGEPSPELSAELRTLEQSLAVARERLEPNTVRILEKNLGVIQRAIDESRRALALDPGNEFLRDHLDRAYRDKADYLRQAAGLADWVS